MHLELPVPDASARKAIMAIHLGKKPVSSDFSTDRLVAETEGLVQTWNRSCRELPCEQSVNL
ncbi:hypothetical protein KJ762_02055 [bacterium]|nr:hypothetical protein [bacterium]MBU1065221.1 hypothetical protein [bacterium]MBU1633274.1 hypothetical protein [bacterium]MBU1874378.1 hypothetical protein [bacterium]